MAPDSDTSWGNGGSWHAAVFWGFMLVASFGLTSLPLGAVSPKSMTWRLGHPVVLLRARISDSSTAKNPWGGTCYRLLEVEGWSSWSNSPLGVRIGARGV